MDPITAVSLASSILTFVDFSYKLLTGTLEVIEAGKTTGTGHTKSVTDDLHKLTAALETEFLEQSDHQVALRILAKKCKALSKRLQEILEKLTAKPGSKWEAVIVTLRTMYRKGDVAGLVAQIGEYRSEIIARLILILNERQVTISVQVASLGNHIDANYSTLVGKLKELQNNILSSVQKSLNIRNDEAKADLKKIDDLQVILRFILDSSSPQTPETRVLRQLYYPSMFLREDQVKKAVYGTFDWILRDSDKSIASSTMSRTSNSRRWPAVYSEEWFQEEMQESYDNQSKARSALVHWLSAENGIFHILGKAGSGKSTLMKLIAENQRTKTELKTWAGEKQLVFAQFFAWRASEDNKQMSLHGLYQSILFSILFHQQSLISIVFPDATQAFYSSRCEPHIDDPYFRFPKLQEALRKLIKEYSTSRFRFCFLIDGLDEFKADDGHTHESLTSELKLWAQQDNIKILVSSRPEPDLIQLAPDRRQIHLHNLTKPDIMKIAKAMFEDHETFEFIRPYYLELTNEVVKRAEGVFLWALFVIFNLRKMAKAGEDLKELRKFLKKGHSLDALYEQILSSINPAYRDMVFKMLFIVLEGGMSIPEISIFAMTWTDEIFDLEFPTNTKIQIYSEEERNRRHILAKSRVAETKGLLEITGTRVEFFHRTARDFFEASQQMRNITAANPDLRNHALRLKIFFATLWFLDLDFTKIMKALFSGMKWRTRSIARLDDDFLSNLSLWLNYEHKVGMVPCHLRERFLDAMETAAIDDHRKTVLNDRILFCGLMAPPDRPDFPDSLLETSYSHLHFVAIETGIGYLKKRLKNTPEAMHAAGELSLLLSAVHGKNVELVAYLLEKGVSPNERIRFYREDDEASVWAIFCALFAAQIVPRHSRPKSDKYSHMLKHFLETGQVDPNVLIILEERDVDFEHLHLKNNSTYKITLKHLVQQLELPNHTHEIWEKLFDNAQKNGVRNLLRGCSYLALKDIGAAFHCTISYLLTATIWRSIQSAWGPWGYFLAQVLGVLVHRMISEPETMASSVKEHKPFKIGMEPELPPDRSKRAREYRFYVHSIVLGGETTVVSNRGVRIY